MQMEIRFESLNYRVELVAALSSSPLRPTVLRLVFEPLRSLVDDRRRAENSKDRAEEIDGSRFNYETRGTRCVGRILKNTIEHAAAR